MVCDSNVKDVISSLKPPHQLDACSIDIQIPKMDVVASMKK